MVQVIEITKAKLLELYYKNLITDIFPVTVGTEKRVYGKTAEGQANNPDGYIIVYAVE